MLPLGRNQAAYDRFTAAVRLPMTVLAALWLPVFVVPIVVHNLPAGLAATLDTADYLIWALFAVEYLAKLYLAPSRLRFAATHLLDLVIIVVPVLRPLRLLRLLRLVGLLRTGLVLTSALRRIRDLLTHRSLHLVLLSVVGIVAVTAALEVMFERGAPGATITTYGQGLWWAVVTVTTVGYGDVHPVTPAGEGVAVVLMITGIGLLGALTATVASYFVEQNSERDKQDLTGRLDRIESMLAQVLAASGGGAPGPAAGPAPAPPRAAAGQGELVLRAPAEALPEAEPAGSENRRP